MKTTMMMGILIARDPIVTTVLVVVHVAAKGVAVDLTAIVSGSSVLRVLVADLTAMVRDAKDSAAVPAETVRKEFASALVATKVHVPDPTVPTVLSAMDLSVASVPNVRMANALDPNAHLARNRTRRIVVSRRQCQSAQRP